jgi:DNA replication protein DnaC
VPRLLGELAIARADGSYTATLSRLAKLDVLVLDDLLIAPLKDGERRICWRCWKTGMTSARPW